MTDSAAVTGGIHLSPRQLDVARLIAKGYDTGEIARELEISPEAANAYVARIADGLPNPHKLKPLRVVRRWAVQQEWLRAAV